MGRDGGPGTISVTLNGEERGIPPNFTISELLTYLDLHERLVVVERNKEIVRRSDYGVVRVLPGDVIELVHFVGGG